MTTATRKLTIKQKFAAVEEAETTRNDRATARKWKVYPSTVRIERKKCPKIKHEIAVQIHYTPGPKA